MDSSLDFNFDREITFDIVLDLISFRLEVFQDSGFLNDIIGKLFPLHIPITIDINLIEQIGQIPDKRNVPIGSIYKPKL